jgi:separase
VDGLTQALDTLFVLARTSLKPKDALTYTPTYDFLAQGVTLLDVDAVGPASDLELASRANLFRCVAGAFHNIAGLLYQEERYASAVRFLKEGCGLGDRALSMSDGGREGRDEAWVVLEQQMYRRWELLGVCYSRIGDRKVGYTH